MNKANTLLKPVSPMSQTSRRCLEDSNGDVARATEQMTAMVHADKALFQQLMWPLVDNACYDAIRQECRLQRRKIWETPRYTEDNILAVASTRLMDMILPGGLKLSEAHKKDLLGAAEFYDRQADNMAHKGRFLSAVAKKLNGKRVNRALDEEQLCELQAKTE